MNAAVFGKSLMVLGRWLAAAFRFFRTALAVLGLIVIVSGAAWMLSRSDAPSGAQWADAWVVESIPAPDRRYKAVVLNENGGGGISPYCFDSVYVSKGDRPDEQAWDDANLVVNGGCGVLVGEWGERIRWTSPTELRIAIDPTVGSRGIATMRLHGYAMSGQVKIVFAARN